MVGKPNYPVSGVVSGFFSVFATPLVTNLYRFTMHRRANGLEQDALVGYRLRNYVLTRYACQDER